MEKLEPIMEGWKSGSGSVTSARRMSHAACAAELSTLDELAPALVELALSGWVDVAEWDVALDVLDELPDLVAPDDLDPLREYFETEARSALDADDGLDDEQISGWSFIAERLGMMLDDGLVEIARERAVESGWEDGPDDDDRAPMPGGSLRSLGDEIEVMFSRLRD